MKLYKHQIRALELAQDKNRVAFYHEMGLGKTFTGAEQLMRCNKPVNLVICQKSKIDDWIEHFETYYNYKVLNLTNKNQLLEFYRLSKLSEKVIGVINYDLAWRRSELLKIYDYTMLLDESSMIQNEKAKRTKFILKLNASKVILLSGTPTGGRYERLYSQLKLLGLDMNKTTYYNHFIKYHFEEYVPGIKTMAIDGYKNVDRLKAGMRRLGCQFLKTEDVIDLPNQVFSKVKVSVSTDYKKFMKNSVVKVDNDELVGDNSLTKLLYARQLCGIYSKDKLNAFKDLMDSTEDRLIVFYNFTEEYKRLKAITDKPVSVINGSTRDLEAYKNNNNSITFIQYQAGAMGLNLQLANKVIYYTPTLSSELFEQSKKRIHRIGQELPCFYYQLIVKGSVEEKIYRTLAKRQNYTERLFEEDN